MLVYFSQILEIRIFRWSKMNWTNSTQTISKIDMVSQRHMTIIEICILSLVFCATVIGNILLISFLMVSRCKNNKFQISRISFYIIHLSVADLIVAFVSILPQILWRNSVIFNHSNFLCKLVTFTQVSFFFQSTKYFIQKK